MVSRSATKSNSKCRSRTGSRPADEGHDHVGQTRTKETGTRPPDEDIRAASDHSKQLTDRQLLKNTDNQARQTVSDYSNEERPQIALGLDQPRSGPTVRHAGSKVAPIRSIPRNQRWSFMRFSFCGSGHTLEVPARLLC